jgi:hypothetical protein
MNPLDEDAAFEAQTYFDRAKTWAGKLSSKETGTDGNAKAWLASFKSGKGETLPFDEVMEAELSLLEEIFGDKANFPNLLLGKEITSDMIASLESIERLFEFKVDDVYDLPTIERQLYMPLCEQARGEEQLQRVVKHLGLDSDAMFDGPAFAALDMTNEHNQTRYFHTLSVVANMIRAKNYEDMDRCFAEWPPKAPFRLGEVNDV